MRFHRTRLGSIEGSMTALVVLLTLLALRCPTWRHTEYVPAADIASDIWPCPAAPSSLPPCPLIPEGLPDRRPVERKVNQTLLDRLAADVESGGRWRPTHCAAQHRSVVVVPLRDRPIHLALFLQHMHPFLQAQLLDYTILVVEQSAEHAFNRAKLFNVGFAEAVKGGSDACCFVFHDVDLLPENPRHMYACSRRPRHLCAALDAFRYVLPYPDIFGGVVALRRDQFEAVAGFSNRFFGWGGEDDELAGRLRRAGLPIVRWDAALSKYAALRHARAPPNPDRHRLLAGDGKEDGLGTLRYRVLARERRPLYTRLLVDVGEEWAGGTSRPAVYWRNLLQK